MPGWIEIIFRSLGAIIFLFLLTRLLGKKQIVQLTPFQYIAGITLGELAGFMSTDIEAHYFYGALALFMWAIIPLAFEFLTLKSKRIRNWVEGNGIVMIKDGKVLENNMKKVRFSSDELLEQLRKKNAFNVADVEFAVLESSGEMNVLLKKENQPLTPKHLGIKVGPEQEPQTVIMDGKVILEPLATIGLSPEWLHTEIEKIGVTVENVYLGQVDSYGQLYVDLYDDRIKVPSPQIKKLLYATLKKCEADLELFCLGTEDEKAKQLYERCVNLMNKVVREMTPLLKR